MNIKEVAKHTRNNLITTVNYGNKEGCDSDHIYWMLTQIIVGKVKDDKAHRWLGWAQAIICVYDYATLEQLKEINKNV